MIGKVWNYKEVEEVGYGSGDSFLQLRCPVCKVRLLTESGKNHYVCTNCKKEFNNISPEYIETN